ncbi:hypothetical protein LCGC14_1227570 [marine sediment metagenome]|uniref:Uncharacterized protein n=1 Tax=marine sediment metagenome TaxID=412755 RepID=A0A0F9PDU5_9ZZZZ
MIRARACLRCKQYVVIHPENPINQLDIKKFEKKHLSHSLMTVGLGEIKGAYSSFRRDGGSKTSKQMN